MSEIINSYVIYQAFYNRDNQMLEHLGRLTRGIGTSCNIELDFGAFPDFIEVTVEKNTLKQNSSNSDRHVEPGVYRVSKDGIIHAVPVDDVKWVGW